MQARSGGNPRSTRDGQFDCSDGQVWHNFRMKWISGLPGLAIAVWIAPLAFGQANAPLDRRVQQLFEQRCAECHGTGQARLQRVRVPRLDAGTDLAALARNPDFVVAGSALASPLWHRISAPADDPNRMPASTATDPHPPLSAAELALVRDWINRAPAAGSALVSDRAVLHSIQQDLTAQPEAQRPYYRYLTLNNLVNAGESDSRLELYRAALNKLINSLSTGPRIVRLVPVNASGSAYRLDLRDYGWGAERWELLTQAYPYGLQFNLQVEQSIAAMTGSELAYLRGDWFTFAASQPPFYHQLLGLPATDRDLEETLEVNVPKNIREGAARRAGFSKSGETVSHRLLERHPRADGAYYWRSYDFEGSIGKRDLFSRPLGPVEMHYRYAFVHDGSEILWSLPNGLQAYLLVDAKGNRLNRASPFMTQDSARRDTMVINGISCLRCHAQGIAVGPKMRIQDEIRTVSLRTWGMTDHETKLVRELYPVPTEFQPLYQGDANRFQTALQLLGVSASAPEPIGALFQRFLDDITPEGFAAELGQGGAADLFRRLKQSADPDLRILAGRLEAGGAIGRQGFALRFRRIAEELQLGQVRNFSPVNFEEFYPTPVRQIVP